MTGANAIGSGSRRNNRKGRNVKKQESLAVVDQDEAVRSMVAPYLGADGLIDTTKVDNVGKVLSWAVGVGGKMWVFAGQLLVAFMDKDPARTASQVEDISPGIINFLEKIGRGQWDYRMIEPCRNTVRIRRLPGSIQKRIFDGERFPMVTEDTTIMVDLRTIEGEAVRQMFNGEQVRTEGEQKAWLASEKIRPVEEDNIQKGPYYFNGKGDLVVREPVIIPRKALQQGLAGT